MKFCRDVILLLSFCISLKAMERTYSPVCIAMQHGRSEQEKGLFEKLATTFVKKSKGLYHVQHPIPYVPNQKVDIPLLGQLLYQEESREESRVLDSSITFQAYVRLDIARKLAWICLDGNHYRTNTIKSLLDFIRVKSSSDDHSYATWPVILVFNTVNKQ